MNFIEKFKSILPKDINFEELKDTVAADIWKSDPETAAIIFLKRNNLFDSERYLSEYSDIRSGVQDPETHYISYGIEENRLFFKNEIDNKKRKIKVSIITPVYNSEKFIAEAIESVIYQDHFLDFELICIDDGSTDNSLKIINTYKKIDNRIILLQQKHRNAGAARNLGLNYANGKYITFLDSDDKIDMNILNKAIKKIEYYKADCLMCCGVEITEKGKEKGRSDYCLRNLGFEYKDIISPIELDYYMFDAFGGVPWGKIFNRNFIIKNKINFLDINRSEDFYFVQLAIARSKKISTLNLPLIKKRFNSYGLENNKDRFPYSFIIAEKRFYHELIKRNMYEKYRNPANYASLNRIVYNYTTFKYGRTRNIIKNKIKRLIKYYRIDNSSFRQNNDASKLYDKVLDLFNK